MRFNEDIANSKHTSQRVSNKKYFSYHDDYTGVCVFDTCY